MQTKSKTRLAAMVVAALSVIGVGGAAIAQTPGAPPETKEQAATVAPADTDAVESENGPDDATEASEGDEAAEAAGESTGVDEQSPGYTGSVTVPNGGADGESAADEAAEAETLSGLARISAEEAKAAALAAVPGNAVQVELDNENGSVVYSVEIDTGSGVVDVKVDAGNASILHEEAEAEG